MDTDDEKLEIRSKKEVQVNIPTQMSRIEEGDIREEDTASQKLKSDHHFTKINNDTGTIVNVNCNHCPKTYKWSAFGGYRTYRKHLEGVHPCQAGLTKTQAQISSCTTVWTHILHNC